jgi:predicted nucleotidyltransferase
MASIQRGWKTRIVRGGFPDRNFDIEFWQEQGDEAIFRAAWDMVVMAEEFKYGREPRLQRTVTRAFNEKKAEYLIVGGYAVMKYTEPRFTKDLDVWIRNSPENAAKVYEALAEFGAPLQKDGLVPEDFTSEDMTYQIGVAPVRIDILTRISGIQFAEAWTNRVASTFFGLPVYFISLRDLIINKKAAGRSSDLEQLELFQDKSNKKSQN